MNLTNFLIWLSPLLNNIASAYSPKNINEIDANTMSSVFYGGNDIFYLLEQEKIDPYFTENLESRTIPIEEYFVPELFIVNSGEFGARNNGSMPISNRRETSDDVTNFSSIDYRTMDAKISDDNSPYFKTSHPKISIDLKGFTDDEIPKVKASIREAIKTFDNTIGIIPSEKEHKCTLTKWDAPNGYVWGQYVPGSNDPENPNIIGCEMRLCCMNRNLE